MGAFQAKFSRKLRRRSGGGGLDPAELCKLKQSALDGKGCGKPVRVPPCFPLRVTLWSRELGLRPLPSIISQDASGQASRRRPLSTLVEYVTK